MSDIIFARARDHYGSYSDLYSLIELSGYPLIFVDEIDPESDNCYIFSTPSTHWHDGLERNGWPGAKARIIYYGLEWYMDVDYNAIPGVETWSGDKWYAELTGTRYVPMGGHPGLRLDEPVDDGPMYDVAWLAYESYRRMRARDLMTTYGLTIAPKGWGSERHQILSHSRCMVHVHQLNSVEDDPFGSPIATVCPLRWVLAAAYELPMITETLADCGVFTAGYRLMSSFDYLASHITNWLEPANANQLRDVGHALHRLLCHEYTFRKGIEAHV